jgi:endoglucanase
MILGGMLLSLPARMTATDAFYTIDLSSPSVRANLEAQGGTVLDDGPDGSPCVRFTLPAGASDRRNLTAAIPLNVGPLQGARVSLTANIRRDGIIGLDPAKPLPGYLGGKCQLALETANGRRWLDARALHGTFDWRESGTLGGVPDDASSASIRIGLENATGTIWLSNIRLRIVQPKVTRARPSEVALQAASSAHTTLRGFMSPQTYREKDFADLQTLNVNAVRWQLYQQANDPTPYDTWLARELDDLDKALDGAARHGLVLAVDLHSPPGGRLPDRTMRMFMEKTHADHFVAIWEEIARRFKGRPGLWAYNLVNEPVQNLPSPKGLDDWLALQVRAARAIRNIDPITPIMIEADQWSSPETFAWLKPLDVPGIIYQAHMYWPGEYTHQGVRTGQGVADGKDAALQAIPYPGELHGAPFNKEALRRYLQPVRDFQLATGAPIFIGEFSVIRWAPGGAQYLDDLISIFEEYGWNWTYHAFREWPGWSVEHADLPRDRDNHSPAVEPTERMQVLKKWLSLNTRSPSP